MKLPQRDPAAIFEQIFHASEWGSFWRNGIYPYHHDRSTVHEVLGISYGEASVRLGGDERGQTFEVRSGDVIIILAGVAAKNLGSSSDFQVVGAYPLEQKWDMNYLRSCTILDKRYAIRIGEQFQSQNRQRH